MTIFMLLLCSQRHWTIIPALPFCKVALRAKRPVSATYPKRLKTLGDHLRKRRLDLKMLQKDVAKEFGATVCTYRNWEKNRSNPSLVFMPMIIEFLGYAPYDTSQQDFGKKITAGRRHLGLSQKALAHQIGVDPCTIRSWEKGKHGPSKKYRKRLVVFLSEN